MAFVKQMESNTNYSGRGYMPELSTSIKNLAISATGTEVFDLGDEWKLIDNIVVSFVNCLASASSTITARFSDTASLLNGVLTVNTMAGLAPNAISAISSSASVSIAVFALKVTARYVRITLANGTASAQPATAYIDVRGYSLTP